MSSVLERFLRYVKIDTQSDEKSETCPSTAKQFDLAHVLVKELQELGLGDAEVDKNGYVMATLPANGATKAPVIGFSAHMDTATGMSGANVKPRIVEKYDGSDILLNKELNIVLSQREFPELKNYAGQDLVVTDGTTLLGADDKAGIAEIMTAIEYLVKHPEIKHGKIRLGFTPDEEIGRGPHRFDVKKFGADFAYTLDGGEVGDLNYETFNAANVKVSIQGRAIHPGSAKNKMINALLVGMELHAMLPVEQRPEYTEGYEGFFHLDGIQGDVEKSHMDYLIRDHDRGKFQVKKDLMNKAAEYLNLKYGAGTVVVDISDRYYNMREKIEPVIQIFETAKKAMQAVGITPIVSPVRGGTDGSQFSYMGLPTPNIFTGGHNAHGKFEYVPVQSMEKAVEVVLKIIELYSA